MGAWATLQLASELENSCMDPHLSCVFCSRSLSMLQRCAAGAGRGRTSWISALLAWVLLNDKSYSAKIPCVFLSDFHAKW